MDLLQANGIEFLADIRSFPGSRRLPHFNKDSLEKSLAEKGIKYLHMPELGGRRKARPDSKNTAWDVGGFRGYADYMETEDFRRAAERLEGMGEKNRVAYMCAEAVWWSCHRSLLSDWFKWRGWKVMHIMSPAKTMEHPYTKPAKIVSGRLSYGSNQLSII